MIIGIDLGGMSAKGAILSDGKLIGKSRVETFAEHSPEETAASLARLCVEVAEKTGRGLDAVQAIGIGSPGIVDSATGTVAQWANFNWRDVPLAEYLKRSLGKPVFVTNDANAAALGEAKYGAGVHYRDSVLITIGTGIGSGIILDGKLFEGYRSAGSEIGHMVICRNGEPCACGRRGCFERYASARALIARTRSEMEADPDSALWEFAPSLDKADGRTVFSALKKGDKGAKRVLEDYISALGEGLLNVANIFRPQAIILGGGISAEGETLLAPLREYIYPRLYVSEVYAPMAIICAKLGNDAGLYGAVEYAFERL